MIFTLCFPEPFLFWVFSLLEEKKHTVETFPLHGSWIAFADFYDDVINIVISSINEYLLHSTDSYMTCSAPKPVWYVEKKNVYKSCNYWYYREYFLKTALRVVYIMGSLFSFSFFYLEVQAFCIKVSIIEGEGEWGLPFWYLNSHCIRNQSLILDRNKRRLNCLQDNYRLYFLSENLSWPQDTLADLISRMVPKSEKKYDG